MHLHCNLNFRPDFLLDRVQIRKNFLYKVCSPKYQLPFSCLHFYIHSSYFWRKTSLNLAGQRSTCFRRLFSVKPTLRPVPYRHMTDEHRRVLLLTRTPALCVSSHRILLQLGPEPLSPCLETTRAAGKAIGRRPCHRPVFSPLAPPLPGSALHLSALPASAAHALAWRLALRRSAPVVALLLNVFARPVASHCRHRPHPPIPGRALH